MRFALATTALILTGCDIKDIRTGPLEHSSQSVELGKSEMARVEVKMGAGELTIDGGSSKLMDANFEYNIPSSKPIVRTESSSFRSEVFVEQPENSHGGSHSIYKWNLQLNNSLPLDVIAHLGAGEARMNLGSVTLRSLEINMGVGELQLDLRGNPKRDYDVKITGGVGNAIIHVPLSVGIVADAKGGIGNIDVRGLEKRDGRWVNSTHDHFPVTIHLDVHGGIGNITLAAE
jgi:hypothetical protein